MEDHLHSLCEARLVVLEEAVVIGKRLVDLGSQLSGLHDLGSASVCQFAKLHRQAEHFRMLFRVHEPVEEFTMAVVVLAVCHEQNQRRRNSVAHMHKFGVRESERPSTAGLNAA